MYTVLHSLYCGGDVRSLDHKVYRGDGGVNMVVHVVVFNDESYWSTVEAVHLVKVQSEALAESSVMFSRVFRNKMGRRLTVVEESLFMA